MVLGFLQEFMENFWKRYEKADRTVRILFGWIRSHEHKRTQISHSAAVSDKKTPDDRRNMGKTYHACEGKPDQWQNI